MDALDAIRSRRSVKKLRGPGPSASEIAELLELASTAPDHGGLKPWRYVPLSGPELDAFPIDPGGSPTVIVAGLEPSGGKIPENEQLAAVAAGCQLILLAADAMGYGAMWRTGSAAYDDGVRSAAGLGPNGRVVAFIHVGTPESDDGSTPRKSTAAAAATHVSEAAATMTESSVDDGDLGIGSLRNP